MKPIPRFEGYFITKNGDVFSKIKRYQQKIKLRQLSPFLSRGYKAVSLIQKGKSKKVYVHRLVLETFFGECPKGWQCRHLNGKRDDNRLKNLKWGTRQENQMDRVTHGTDNRGDHHGMSRLNEKEVRQIRELAGKKVTNREKDIGGNYKEIAKKFNIAPSTVGAIVRRTAWKWLK